MESMRVCAGGVLVRPLPNSRLVCEAGVKGWRRRCGAAAVPSVFSGDSCARSGDSSGTHGATTSS